MKNTREKITIIIKKSKKKDKKEKTYDLVAKDDSKDYFGKIELIYTIKYEN